MSKRPCLVLVGIVSFGTGALVTATVGHTYAAFSDYQVVHASASAGTWGPPTPPSNPNEPAQCVAAGMTFDAAHTIILKHTVNTYTAPAGATAGYLIVATKNGANDIHGSGLADCIWTKTGAANVHGEGGNDVIVAGDGFSLLAGDDGNDTIVAGSGAGLIFGGDGNDTLSAGQGLTGMDGGAGDDTCHADKFHAYVGCEHTS